MMKDRSAYIDRTAYTFDLYFQEFGSRPGPDAYPLVCMSQSTAEDLMRELWAHGIRPPESQYEPVSVAGELKVSDGEVKALRAHIADLRKILFSKRKA
jgi:hypothetical protein